MERPIHLGYHYIADTKSSGPTCSPQRLVDQITKLADDGYEIMTCGQVADLLNTDKKLPDKHATLSFDDGLKNQYLEAWPVLRRLGVPATFFYIADALGARLPPVIAFQILIDQLGPDKLEHEILPSVFHNTPYADLLDPNRFDITGRKTGESPDVRRIKYVFNHFPSQGFKRDVIDHIYTQYFGENGQQQLVTQWFMTADELLALQNQGMEVASHSVSHPSFNTSGKEEIRQEVKISKEILEQVLGETVSTFGYPFGGDFKPETRKIVLDFYTSGWNYTNDPGSIPTNPYGDISNIHRLNAQTYKTGN